jgi:hypothetical protein
MPARRAEVREGMPQIVDAPQRRDPGGALGRFPVAVPDAVTKGQAGERELLSQTAGKARVEIFAYRFQVGNASRSSCKQSISYQRLALF